MRLSVKETAALFALALINLSATSEDTPFPYLRYVFNTRFDTSLPSDFTAAFPPNSKNGSIST